MTSTPMIRLVRRSKGGIIVDDEGRVHGKQRHIRDVNCVTRRLGPHHVTNPARGRRTSFEYPDHRTTPAMMSMPPRCSLELVIDFTDKSTNVRHSEKRGDSE